MSTTLGPQAQKWATLHYGERDCLKPDVIASYALSNNEAELSIDVLSRPLVNSVSERLWWRRDGKPWGPACDLRFEFTQMALPRQLIDIQTIYHEPAVENYARGREILSRYPHANRIPVASHWMISSLHGNEGLAEDWLRIKSEVLVLEVKKSLVFRPNGRSAHFIAPSTSNGCAMACAYCYVSRRKGYAYPISIFVNIDETCRAIRRHAARQGGLPRPDQIDGEYWVYDMRENGDLSIDAVICDNVRDLVATFREIPNAKGSFATKYVNPDLLAYEPRGKTRIASLLCQTRSQRWWMCVRPLYPIA